MKVFTIEGENIGSIEDFWTEVGRSINGPGGYFGRNFDALVDCLRGDYGTPNEDYEIRWRNSDQSKHTLGYPATVRYLEQGVNQAHPRSREASLEKLEDAKVGAGPTLFDRIVEIINDAPLARLVLE